MDLNELLRQLLTGTHQGVGAVTDAARSLNSAVTNPFLFAAQQMQAQQHPNTEPAAPDGDPMGPVVGPPAVAGAAAPTTPVGSGIPADPTTPPATSAAAAFTPGPGQMGGVGRSGMGVAAPAVNPMGGVPQTPPPMDYTPHPNGGYNQYPTDAEAMNEDLIANPELALYRAIGGVDRGNFLTRRAIGQFAPLLGDLAAIAGMVRGGGYNDPHSVDVGAFAKELMGGVLGAGHAPDISAMVRDLLNRGASGDSGTLDCLGTMDPTDIARVMLLGERRHGLLPQYAKVRENVLKREIMRQQEAMLGRGATDEMATADTQAWARMLAGLAR
jgi:hypothetical protein